MTAWVCFCAQQTNQSQCLTAQWKEESGVCQTTKEMWNHTARALSMEKGESGLPNHKTNAQAHNMSSQHQNGGGGGWFGQRTAQRTTHVSCWSQTQIAANCHFSVSFSHAHLHG